MRRVHDAAFVRLGDAWAAWSATGRTHDALPLVWPVSGLRMDRADRSTGFGILMDAGTPITAGTWDAVAAGADVA
ncbi:MAG: hypothetical protein U0Q12_02880 [Vicinamibacterales bacterium]